MKLSFFAWFLFMASASFWMPAYKGYFGDFGDERASFIPLYVLVTVLAAIGIRKRIPSMRAALISTLPAVVLLVAAAVTGYLMNEGRAPYRGEPIFLFFGVAMWSSWAALVVSSALLSRAKWNGIMGSGVTFLVAYLGLFMFVNRSVSRGDRVCAPHRPEQRSG